jgi:hypothetical protein
MQYLTELVQWFSSLDRGFAFLLSIPVLVVVAGFASHLFLRRHESTRGPHR